MRAGVCIPYNFTSGVHFCGESFCGNLILQEQFYVDHGKSRKKWQKDFLPHGSPTVIHSGQRYAPGFSGGAKADVIAGSLSRKFPYFDHTVLKAEVI